MLTMIAMILDAFANWRRRRRKFVVELPERCDSTSFFVIVPHTMPTLAEGRSLVRLERYKGMSLFQRIIGGLR